MSIQLTEDQWANVLQGNEIPVRVSDPAQSEKFVLLRADVAETEMLEGADDLFALADRERAIQVLASITDNAAKYSPEGSPILIRWTAEDKHVVIRVFDAGTGIPDQGRDRLFTRFGRIPGSRIRAGHVGTGLGLYMGQRLARAMDGDLDLETTSPNGSVFKLMLPVAVD